MRSDRETDRQTDLVRIIVFGFPPTPHVSWALSLVSPLLGYEMQLPGGGPEDMSITGMAWHGMA